MKRKPIELDEYTQEELLKMKKSEATKGLSEKVQRFCEYYIEGHNRRIALVKAGYEASTVTTYGHRLLMDKRVQLYIQWLKARAVNDCLVNAADLIDSWVRIAFSDITDFVNIYPHSISLKSSDEMDGQLVKSIKSGRDGISIELHDKMKALESLAKYISDMPADWKQKLEERKVELMEEEFNLKKKLYADKEGIPQDDGFIQAIKDTAKIIWKEE